MKMRRLAPIALALLTAPLLAQTVPAPVAAPPAAAPVPALPKPATVRVTLTTSQGPIVLELEKERAPITTTNFLKYVDQKRFDNITFYRVVKVQPGFGLVQGGLRNDPKRVLPNIPHEPTTKTGLHHDDGVISMARAAPGTASADFFIMVGAAPSMDADPSQPGDNQGFAAFGHVVEGMDIVRKLLDAPTSATAGPAVMKGQMLVAPLKILTARRGG